MSDFATTVRAALYHAQGSAGLEALNGLVKQKDGAYAERNRCVVALARLALMLGMRAGVGRHPESDTAWEDDWRTIVFIDLPTGQASWHFHDSERNLLTGLPEYAGAWDGHSNDEKYARLAALASQESA